MKDKRISLRFRADNERDMETWKMLEEMAQKKNASKNSVAIELILSGSTKRNVDDVLAERIAELVADKLTNKLTMQTGSSVSNGAIVSGDGRDEDHDETKSNQTNRNCSGRMHSISSIYLDRHHNDARRIYVA